MQNFENHDCSSCYAPFSETYTYYGTMTRADIKEVAKKSEKNRRDVDALDKFCLCIGRSIIFDYSTHIPTTFLNPG